MIVKNNVFILSIVALAILGMLGRFYINSSSKIPVVYIANYGPHISLQDSIKGVRDAIKDSGFVINKDIKIVESDVNFQAALIPQMISTAKTSNPSIVVTLSTPVAQSARALISENTPIIFNSITDPVDAGIVDSYNNISNITGVTDKQDLDVALDFMQKIVPSMKTVGILYSTSEDNDIALLKSMESATKKAGLSVFAIPVDEAREVQTKMNLFKDKVDAIYVGTSGALQPTLPTIAAAADSMRIPVFNADSNEVKNHTVLGSFGVDYYKAGVSTGMLVVRVLKGEEISNISVQDPNLKDYGGFISKIKAKQLGITIPKIDNLTQVD